MSDGGTAAALCQLAQMRAELAQVQGQITSNWVRVTAKLSELSAQIEAMGQAAAQQGDTVAQLTAVVDAMRDGGEESGEGYSPIPAPQWWHLKGDERAEAIERLSDWVAAVYVPGYGTLASRLPGCWAEHPLCLFALDWLSEMHSLLYLQPERDAGMLAAQAEWQARLLPAAVDQMAEECRSCDHTARNGAWR